MLMSLKVLVSKPSDKMSNGLSSVHACALVLGALPKGKLAVAVNKPDTAIGYNGVNDDQGRAEYNLGVAGDRNFNSDISGYWPGQCEASCANEAWAQGEAFDRVALVEVWHR